MKSNRTMEGLLDKKMNQYLYPEGKYLDIEMKSLKSHQNQENHISNYIRLNE